MHAGQRRAMQLKQQGRAQANLTLVYGPPCAGKTTYVLDQAGPDDVIIDYDLIAQDLGSSDTHDHDVPHTTILNEMARRLESSRSAPRAWLVKCEPTASDMRRSTLHVLINPGLDVCIDRASSERPERWIGLVRDWFARHPKAVIHTP